MIVYLIADTHLNHANIATYCDRPRDFTGMIIKRWNAIVKPEDLVIHLGDVAIGPKQLIEFQVRSLAGRKVLVRGNHDNAGGNNWWMEHGFDFACDAMLFRNHWLTHEPAKELPPNCQANIHGHLHNIWGKKTPAPNQEGYVLNEKLAHPWQRLFALEYTNYMPVEFEKFVSHPDRWLARGPREARRAGLPDTPQQDG
jgi:calcineurin-like phosphoesterase family protein